MGHLTQWSLIAVALTTMTSSLQLPSGLPGSTLPVRIFGGEIDAKQRAFGIHQDFPRQSNQHVKITSSLDSSQSGIALKQQYLENSDNSVGTPAVVFFESKFPVRETLYTVNKSKPIYMGNPYWFPLPLQKPGSMSGERYAVRRMQPKASRIAHDSDMDHHKQQPSDDIISKLENSTRSVMHASGLHQLRGALGNRIEVGSHQMMNHTVGQLVNQRINVTSDDVSVTNAKHRIFKSTAMKPISRFQHGNSFLEISRRRKADSEVLIDAQILKYEPKTGLKSFRNKRQSFYYRQLPPSSSRLYWNSNNRAQPTSVNFAVNYPSRVGLAPMNHVNSWSKPTGYQTGTSFNFECYECPQHHVILAPRGMNCAPLHLPPVRACRRHGSLGNVMRVAYTGGTLPGTLFGEGIHTIALRLRTPSGKQWPCVFDLSVQVRRCSALPEAPKYGRIKCNQGTLWGSKCEFQCDPGFKRIGDMTTTCDETVGGSLDWINPTPLCRAKLPPVPKDGICGNRTILTHDEYTTIGHPEFVTAHGAYADIRCLLDDMKLPHGTYQNTCEATDEEMHTGMTCTYTVIIKSPGCLNPSTDGVVLSCNASGSIYPVGTVCSYGCPETHAIPRSMTNRTVIMCEPSLKWNVSNTPSCRPLIPPEPLASDCQDVTYYTKVPATFEVPQPQFTTADGGEAFIDCDLNRISTYGKFMNNCTATDLEMGSVTRCSYEVTIQGTQCPSLSPPTNGMMTCNNNLEGIYRCDIACNKGYRLPSSYKFLERGFVECDPSSGNWDFQHETTFGRLPDCLGELPSTALSASLHFNVSVPDCQSQTIMAIFPVIKENLLQRNALTCQELDCSDLTHKCIRVNGKSWVLQITWNVHGTYMPPEKDYEDYAIPEAEEFIEQLQMDTQTLIRQDVKFMDKLSEAGVKVIIDSVKQSHIDLICAAVGYAVDPSSYRCVQCPTGYYQLLNDCLSCPFNTYQDKTGQTMCLPCPNGTMAPAGTYSKVMCKTQ